MTKRTFLTTAFATLAVIWLPLATPVAAIEAKAEIPFAFSVPGADLPAGTYTFSTQGNAVFARGLKLGVFFLGTRMESLSGEGSKLIFEKVGSYYVLVEVWSGGTGRDLRYPGGRSTTSERFKAIGANVPVERIVIPLM